MKVNGLHIVLGIMVFALVLGGLRKHSRQFEARYSGGGMTSNGNMAMTSNGNFRPVTSNGNAR